MKLDVVCCQCHKEFILTNPLNNETGLWICDDCNTVYKKKQFIQRCGELLAIAKPHLIKTEYKLGREIPTNEFKRIIPGAEYAVVTCENGYTYEIDITANSLVAIAEAIFKAMAHK